MVLASASAFGTIPILAKFAYAVGLTPLQVLTYRFLIASLGLAAIALVTGQGPAAIGWKRSLTLLGVGLFFYAGMAGTFFGALTALPASLAELIAYIYPTLVAIGAWAFFGGEMNRRVALALVISFAGLALLVGTIQPAKVSLETPSRIAHSGVRELLKGLVESQGLVFTEDSSFFRISTVLSRPVPPGGAVGVPAPVQLFVIRLKHARAADVGFRIAAVSWPSFFMSPGDGRKPTWTWL